MALISLPNGKTIDVDPLWYLNLSDAEFQELMAMNAGFEIDDPFHGSSMRKHSLKEDEEDPGDLKPLDEINEVDIPERDDT